MAAARKGKAALAAQRTAKSGCASEERGDESKG